MYVHATFFKNYNVGALTYVYGRYRDQIQGYGGVKTTGSSVTVNAVTAGIGTFSPVSVGDLIVFYKSDTSILIRTVATKPSNDQITVDTAIDLDNSGNGYGAWYFQQFQTGNGITDGWLPVQAFGRNKAVRIQFPTVADAGGFDLSIESKGFGFDTAPNQLIEKHYAPGSSTPKDGEHFEIPENVASLRVGLKGSAGFAGTDDISVFLIGDPQRRAA